MIPKKVPLYEDCLSDEAAVQQLTKKLITPTHRLGRARR